MLRPILSILIALVAAALGYLALFNGGLLVFAQTRQFREAGAFPFDGLLLIVVGLLLLAVAMLSVAIAPAGVILLGGVHLVFGLLVVALPFDPLGGFVSPAMALLQAISAVSEPVANGFYFSVPTGMSMLAGVAFLAAGLARPVPAPTPGSRALAAGVGFVSGAAALPLTLTGGAIIYMTMLRFLRGTVEPLGLAMVLAGAALLFVAVFSARWSTVGVLALGVVLTVLGFVGIADFAALPLATRPLSRELSVGTEYAGPTGNLALVGVLVIAAAVGVLLRRRFGSATVYDG